MTKSVFSVSSFIRDATITGVSNSNKERNAGSRTTKTTTTLSSSQLAHQQHLPLRKRKPPPSSATLNTRRISTATQRGVDARVPPSFRGTTPCTGKMMHGAHGTPLVPSSVKKHPTKTIGKPTPQYSSSGRDHLCHPPVLEQLKPPSVPKSVVGEEEVPSKKTSINNESKLLSQLLTEIELLDDEEKAAYEQAIERVPDLVASESDPGRYLRVCRNDVRAAAKRLALYWTKRLALFGTDRAFLPMTQTGSGALSTDDVEVLKSGTWAVLPKDRSGRMCFLFDEGRVTKALDQRDARVSRFRCNFYVLQTVSENEASRSKGMLLLRRSERPNFAPGRMVNFWSLFQSLPIELAGFYLLFLPKSSGAKGMIQNMLIPAMEQHMPTPLKKVTKSLVAGSVEEMSDKMRKDATLRWLDPRGLPTSLGGSWSYEMFSQWQVHRLRFEQEVHEPKFLPLLDKKQPALPAVRSAASSSSSNDPKIGGLAVLASAAEASGGGPGSSAPSAAKAAAATAATAAATAADTKRTMNMLYARKRRERERDEIHSLKVKHQKLSRDNERLRKECSEKEIMLATAKEVVSRIEQQTEGQGQGHGHEQQSQQQQRGSAKQQEMPSRAPPPPPPLLSAERPSSGPSSSGNDAFCTNPEAGVAIVRPKATTATTIRETTRSQPMTAVAEAAPAAAVVKVVPPVASAAPVEQVATTAASAEGPPPLNAVAAPSTLVTSSVPPASTAAAAAGQNAASSTVFELIKVELALQNQLKSILQRASCNGTAQQQQQHHQKQATNELTANLLGGQLGASLGDATGSGGRQQLLQGQLLQAQLLGAVRRQQQQQQQNAHAGTDAHSASAAKQQQQQQEQDSSLACVARSGNPAIAVAAASAAASPGELLQRRLAEELLAEKVSSLQQQQQQQQQQRLLETARRQQHLAAAVLSMQRSRKQAQLPQQPSAQGTTTATTDTSQLLQLVGLLQQQQQQRR